MKFVYNSFGEFERELKLVVHCCRMPEKEKIDFDDFVSPKASSVAVVDDVDTSRGEYSIAKIT